jgi:hypothetical protein
MLDHALAYAARGWPVFPCYEVVKGRCACSKGANCPRPGKHPRISNGRNGATLDEDLIRRWWDVWPSANIGIATGAESGLLVVDIDDPDARQAWRFPDTVESITGSGGTHLLYRRPNGEHRYRTTTSVVPGIDSRCDGGYIVAPPSSHVQGSYEWEVSGHPDDVEIAEAPEWFVEIIAQNPLHEGTVDPPEWDPDGDLPPNILEMLSMVPAEEYTVWRDVGMALHYHDPSGHGYETFDWWSSTAGAAYDPEGVRREWRNWSRRGHATNEPVTLATIRRLAEAHGWTDPDIEHGAQVAAAFIESHQAKVVERLRGNDPDRSVDPPDELLPKHGIVGDVARWIDSTSVRSQPRLALAASIAMVGAVMGRRYASPTNLRGNVYLVGLAPTGGGKDHARKQVQKLLVQLREEDRLGGDRVASGSAIVNSLESTPEKLYLLDEFGLFVQSMAGQHAAAHRRDIMSVLLSLYSQASGVYLGQEYADQKDRPRQVVHNPHVCVYGTSTPSTFWPALSGSHVLDGTLNRMLVVECGDTIPPRRRDVVYADPPPDLMERLERLRDARPHRGNLVGAAGGRTGEEAYQVPMTKEVQDAEYEFACAMDKLGTTPEAQAVYSRTNEAAIRLALIHAVSLDPEAPVIDVESWVWARDMALWCSNVLMEQATRHVASSEVESIEKRYENAIRDAGEHGLTKSELLRTVRGVRARDRDEAMKTLQDMGVIATIVRNPEGGAGRPATVFVAVDPEAA